MVGTDDNIGKAWKSIQSAIDKTTGVEINAKSSPIDVWGERFEINPDLVDVKLSGIYEPNPDYLDETCLRCGITLEAIDRRYVDEGSGEPICVGCGDTLLKDKKATLSK